MRKSTLKILLFSAGLLFSCTIWAEPMLVFVSVMPQKTFVENIGGEHVVVHAMVQPGDNPALYEPTPRQMQLLSKADIYLTAGIAFEKSWMESIKSINPSITIVDGLDGLKLRTLEAHSHDEKDEHDEQDDHDEQDESELDPHTWTSPVVVQDTITTIRDALIKLNPNNKQNYDRNYTLYNAKLDELDRDIRTLLLGIKSKTFMVFHPAWGYFADTYGLTQIAVEQSGKEPGTKGLKNLIDQAKRDNIKAVFVQPQFSKKSAQIIAKAIDGRVISLDPIAANYGENLRSVARELKKALSR